MTDLVVQTAFLGDVILTTPLLETLAAPTGRNGGPVDVVTTPAAAPLLETHPAVRRVIPYDKHGADRGARGLQRLAARLRAERYAAAYLPHRSLRSAALALMAGIPRRIGFSDGWPWLYTESRRRPAPSEGAHEIDRLLALVGAASPTPRRPSLRLTPEDTAAAAALLRAAGVVEGGSVVALAPGAIWGTKRWGESGYAQLARRLATRCAVVVVGSRDDAPLGERIVAAAKDGAGAKPVVSACGRLTLRESAALLARAALLVTNDSAPLHLAQAVGTPTVAVFGPTATRFGFGPRGPADRVIEVDLACRPCSPHGPPACPLGHHRCMADITVEQVLHTIEETGALHRRS